MSIHVHSAQEGSLTIALLDIEHGKPPGGFLTFSPAVQFTSSRDVQGNVCRHRTNDPRVGVQLKLFNWSRHNQELSILMAGDTVVNGGAGIGAFSWIDNAGATTVISDACWVMQAPTDWTVGEEAFEVTWNLEIVAPPSQLILGGN